MSWDILPKANLQYFLQKLKDKLGDLAFLNKDGVNSSKYLRGDGVWNKPVVEMSYADYQALELAGEVDPNVAYYLPDAPSLYPPVQDNGSATTLNNGDLPTGQTIVSYLNSNFVVGKGTHSLGGYVCSGYITGSGNYFSFFVPMLIDPSVTTIALNSTSLSDFTFSIYGKTTNYAKSDFDFTSTTIDNRVKGGLKITLKFTSTKSPNELGIIAFTAFTLKLS